MSSTLALPRDAWKSVALSWGLVGLGLAFLFIPTYLTLWNGVWQSEEQAHGPLILLVVVWLLWRDRAYLSGAQGRDLIQGYLLLVGGLLFYVLGRSQEILIFEVGSQIPVLAGVILVMVGHGALRRVWFPLFFIVFMLPLPSFLVDALTGPLKREVSEVAEHVLYWLGYPIGRSGVVLTVGPYQLLVADACSGLHSMFSLSALGFLYLHLASHASRLRNIIIAAAILPIAFGANIVRVLLLIMVTYHFGDAAGQGFVHGFAGISLFIAALGALMGLDVVLGALLSRGRPVRT